MRPHARFPQQQNIQAVKPLLKDVIIASDSFAMNNSIKKPFYNIEIKRDPELGSLFQPSAEEFAQLVIDQVEKYSIADRVCLQSFDLETLKAIKRFAPKLTMALLVENEKSFQENLAELGFTPDIYGPYFKLISQELVDQCKDKNMLIIHWTVNEEEDARRLIGYGVDGIITDYPDKVKAILNELEIAIKKTTIK